MKTILSVASLLLPLLATAAPPSSKVVAEAKEREALLRAWEKGYKAPRDFSYSIELTEEDPVYKTSKKSVMEATGAAPGILRVVQKDEQGKTTSQFLMTEKQLRWFKYDNQTELVFVSAPRKPSGWFNFFNIEQTFRDCLAFPCFRLNPRDIQERFQIEEMKQDENYLYLTLRPRVNTERRQISLLWLAVDKSGWTVPQFLFDYPSGGRSIWQFKQRRENLVPAVTLEMLCKDLPQGWERHDPSKAIDALNLQKKKKESP